MTIAHILSLNKYIHYFFNKDNECHFTSLKKWPSFLFKCSWISVTGEKTAKTHVLNKINNTVSPCVAVTHKCRGPAGQVGGSGCSMSSRGGGGGGGSSCRSGPRDDGCSSALLLHTHTHFSLNSTHEKSLFFYPPPKCTPPHHPRAE